MSHERPNPFRKRKGHWTTIRRFATKRFVVKLQWEPEQFAELSWMDAADHRKIESGEWINCTFRVAVFLDGARIVEQSLGNSVYADPADFAREHYGTAGTGAGGYFSDMVREAIRDARKHVSAMSGPPRVRL